MHNNLLQAEKSKYRDVWMLQDYSQHSPGVNYLSAFLQMSDANPGEFVLDAGAGSGKGSTALKEHGFDVVACDFVLDGFQADVPHFEACLWKKIPTIKNVGHYLYDWVYCTDVLEHIPTSMTMLVVSRLLDVAHRGVFLSISTVPDQFGAWVGKPLHETVQGFTWWRDNLAAIATVKESRDLINAGLFLVTR